MQEQNTEKTAPERAKEFADGLRALAAMVETNPELAGHFGFSLGQMIAPVGTADNVAAFARAGLRAGARLSTNPAGEWRGVKLHFGSVVIEPYVKTEELPDPAALIAELVAEVAEEQSAERAAKSSFPWDSDEPRYWTKTDQDAGVEPVDVSLIRDEQGRVWVRHGSGRWHLRDGVSPAWRWDQLLSWGRLTEVEAPKPKPFSFTPGGGDADDLREEYAGDTADREERATEAGYVAWLERQLLTARADLKRYAAGAR